MQPHMQAMLDFNVHSALAVRGIKRASDLHAEMGNQKAARASTGEKGKRNATMR